MQKRQKRNSTPFREKNIYHLKKLSGCKRLLHVLITMKFETCLDPSTCHWLISAGNITLGMVGSGVGVAAGMRALPPFWSNVFSSFMQFSRKNCQRQNNRLAPPSVKSWICHCNMPAKFQASMAHRITSIKVKFFCTRKNSLKHKKVHDKTERLPFQN